MNALDQLLLFLRHAPALFSAAHHPLLLRIHPPLPHYNEPIACVAFDGRYMVSGTDILRILLFRFRCLGRPLASLKKFEEGVFSDLRNLKPGDGCRLEPARSPLLDILYRFGCIRTQKRQKVFFWDVVDHERLFRDSWEREMRREREAIDAFLAEYPEATLDHPNVPIVKLDAATEETALHWQSERPLALTQVRSMEEPAERVLNVISSIPSIPSLSAETLQFICPASVASHRLPSMLGSPVELNLESMSIAVNERNVESISKRSRSHTLQSSSSLSTVQDVGTVLQSEGLREQASLLDAFMDMTSLDLPTLAVSTTGLAELLPTVSTVEAPALPSWMFTSASDASGNPSGQNDLTTTANPTCTHSTSSQRLLEELEAFLTPPTDAIHRNMVDVTLPSSTESFLYMDQCGNNKNNKDADVNNGVSVTQLGHTNSSLRSNTPWPIPSTTKSTSHNIPVVSSTPTSQAKAVHLSAGEVPTPPWNDEPVLVSQFTNELRKRPCQLHDELNYMINTDAVEHPIKKRARTNLF